jgi:hypothetical protein
VREEKPSSWARRQIRTKDDPRTCALTKSGFSSHARVILAQTAQVKAPDRFFLARAGNPSSVAALFFK